MRLDWFRRRSATTGTSTERPGGVLLGLNARNGKPIRCDPLTTTVIVGGSGSGRSSVLATRIARMASLGMRIVAVAPYWMSNGWFRGPGGQSIRIGPSSTWHHDPLALQDRLPDERADDLRPLFAVLLGEQFDAIADDLVRAALLAFYASPDKEGMGDFISMLATMDRAMTPTASRKREEIVLILERLTVTGPLSRYFRLPAEPLPGANVRRLLIHPETSADPLERSLLACLALSLATDVLVAGHDTGALLVDDTDVLLGSAPGPIDEALVNFARLGRRHQLGLSLGFTLASTTKPGWRLPHVLGIASSWIVLEGDEDLVRGWAMALPHQVHPKDLADAIAARPGERLAALVEAGRITSLRPVVLPGEEAALGDGF